MPVQAVNFNSYEQQVSVSIGGKDISFEDAAVLHSVTGDHPEAENSFDDPEYVRPVAMTSFFWSYACTIA